MLKVNKFVSPFIFLLFLLLNNNLKAQEFYKGNPWLFNYNLNILIEDAEQFRSYFNGTQVKWNISPFNFSAEKRMKRGTAIVFNIGSNLYPINQQIDGLTLIKPVDIFYFETGYKYNLNYVVKEDNKFDPYFEIDAGLWVKNNEIQPSLGVGFGFNHWFTNNIGLRSNFQYKFLYDPNYAKASNRTLTSISLGIVHIVN